MNRIESSLNTQKLNEQKLLELKTSLDIIQNSYSSNQEIIQELFNEDSEIQKLHKSIYKQTANIEQQLKELEKDLNKNNTHPEK